VIPLMFNGSGDFGQDEVSFHMSGTEAVMQAVGLPATTQAVLFGAFLRRYHGWWGMCNRVSAIRPSGEYLHLKDMSEDSFARVCAIAATLRACLSIRAGAASNAGAFSDSRWSMCKMHNFDKEAYTMAEAACVAVCTERNIVLIFDEVSSASASHLAGEEYFGIRRYCHLWEDSRGGFRSGWSVAARI